MSASNAQSQIELHRQLAPRYAFRYGMEFSRLFQEDWHREMMSYMPPTARRVLDLGCGTGFFLAELEQQRPGAVGLDISYEMLQVSEQYVPGARVITADAETLPFADCSFDAIFCKGCLHHTRDHVAFLANCRRALSPDGIFVLSEPCNDNFMIRWARFLLYKFSPYFDLGDQGFTKQGIGELCEQAGFEIVESRRYGVLAYMFGGFPDHLGLLRWIPGNTWILKQMLKLDRFIVSTRVLRILAFQIVIAVRPKRAPAADANGKG